MSHAQQSQVVTGFFNVLLGGMIGGMMSMLLLVPPAYWPGLLCTSYTAAKGIQCSRQAA